MDPETDIMEQPWGLSDYKPTKIIHIWQKRLSEAQVVSLSARRATDTKNINRHPYDPELWIKRAYAHAVLGYPELAVGDAFKAELLCRKLLAELDQNLKPNYRIGVHAGFWMRHEDPEDEYDEVPPWLDTIDLEKEHSKHQTKFTCILDDAEKVKRANLVFSPHREEGKFSPQAYPWMSREHSMRLEYDIDQINAELQNPLVSRPTGLMVVKRYAFGKGVGRQDGADLLGGFALRDIEEDEMVINDRSKLWVCFCDFTSLTAIMSNHLRLSERKDMLISTGRDVLARARTMSAGPTTMVFLQMAELPTSVVATGAPVSFIQTTRTTRRIMTYAG